MQELQLLNDKLDLLLKNYALLQSENKRLTDTVAQQTKFIEQLNSKLSEVEHQILTNQIGHAVVSEEDKEKMKKQIDHVIGEIDKILLTLHD